MVSYIGGILAIRAFLELPSIYPSGALAGSFLKYTSDMCTDIPKKTQDTCEWGPGSRALNDPGPHSPLGPLREILLCVSLKKRVFLCCVCQCCAYPRLQWIARKRHLESWLKFLMLSMMCCLTLAVFCLSMMIP